MIIAVIVVYNRTIKESPSFKAAIAQKNVKVLVVDNSSIDTNNQEEAETADAWYISMHGNKGLSKAYNAARVFLKNKKADCIVLLDDDTIIPDSYWKSVQTLTLNNDIYLPVVRTINGDIISPADISVGIPRKVSNYKTIKKITGINSGMVISKSIWDSYGYDENIFLDNVDHDYISVLQKKGIKIHIFDSELVQNFSAETRDYEILINRFRVFKQDTKYFYRNRPLVGWFVIIKRKIKIFLMTKKGGIFRL